MNYRLLAQTIVWISLMTLTSLGISSFNYFSGWNWPFSWVGTSILILLGAILGMINDMIATYLCEDTVRYGTDLYIHDSVGLLVLSGVGLVFGAGFLTPFVLLDISAPILRLMAVLAGGFGAIIAILTGHTIFQGPYLFNSPDHPPGK